MQIELPWRGFIFVLVFFDWLFGNHMVLLFRRRIRRVPDSFRKKDYKYLVFVNLLPN